MFICCIFAYMKELFPPDRRVFIDIENKVKNLDGTIRQIDAVIKKTSGVTDFKVGQRVCVLGKIDVVELQDITEYSVHEKNILFIYE